MKKIKIKRRKDGTFRKGEKPLFGFHTGHGISFVPPKGSHMCERTEFKKGNMPVNFQGIKVPRIINHHSGKYVETTVKEKVPAISRGRKYMTKKRTTYARVVVGYKRIPIGHVVYHKDGNPLNNERKNLVIISRGTLIKINRGNWSF